MYRVGFPGWKLAARVGIPVLVRIHAHYDAESKSYWADSPDLDGMVVAGGDLDELQQEAIAATGELLSLAMTSKSPHVQTELRVRGPAICAA